MEQIYHLEGIEIHAQGPAIVWSSEPTRMYELRHYGFVTPNTLNWHLTEKGMDHGSREYSRGYTDIDEFMCEREIVGVNGSGDANQTTIYTVHVRAPWNGRTMFSRYTHADFQRSHNRAAVAEQKAQIVVSLVGRAGCFGNILIYPGAVAQWICKEAREDDDPADLARDYAEILSADIARDARAALAA